jgi:septum formation protein
MAPGTSQQPLILASASRARAQLLRNAGLRFEVDPADIDEAAIRSTLGSGTDAATPSDVAVVLAQTKASTVSARHPDALVIGADQVLVCDGELFSKPQDRTAARDQLVRLRARSHALISAVSCAVNGSVDWYHEETAHLTMREFSNAFLGTYLAEAGDALTTSVGAYQIEGPGIQLFSSIDGDYCTVLGMPLLPLLAYLRTQTIVQD